MTAKTLDALIGEIGEDNVRHIVTEYLMLQLAKAAKLDELAGLLHEGRDVDSDTVRRIIGE